MSVRRKVLAAALLSWSLPAQAPVPPAARKPLETLAQDLAKAGYGDEGLEIAEVLEALGHEAAATTALRTTVTRLQAKAPKTPGAPDRSATNVKRAAAALAAQLPGSSDKAALAQAVLRLDDQHEDARLALGFRLVDGTWSAPGDAALRQRRVAIQDAVDRALRLPILVASAESPQPLYPEIVHAKGSVVSYQNVRLHSNWPAEKSVRVLRSALRVMAVHEFLIHGKLEVVTRKDELELVHLGSRSLFAPAIESMIAAGKLPATARRDAKTVGGLWLEPGKLLCWTTTEAQAAATLVFFLLGNQSTQWMVGGEVNWLCRAVLGEPIPLITWDEAKAGKGAHDTVSGKEQLERQWRQRLAKAGIAGARSWMAWLAARKQDPAWSSCFVDQVGKLQGDDLLKVTFACEFLAEHDQLAAVWAADAATFAATVEKTLGVPPSGFDARFRAWIVPPRPGLAQRLTAAARPMPPEDAAALAKLNALRAQALVPDWWTVEPLPEARLDAELSAGARAHAEYLQRHPAQVSSWPEAHEEYPDQAGYSPGGAWAGSHSVIAPGKKSQSEAIDAWMATFYHRLPLLEPGLLQVGMARVGDLAVLDASSMSVPAGELAAAMVWPPRDGKNVPLRFVPEMPNPVPDQDQARLGYPVTLQYGETFLDGAAVQMELHLGAATGPVVDCWFATPSQPSNPVLAPRNAFCLIPKTALQANTQYTVVVSLGSQGRHDWSFRTGSK